MKNWSSSENNLVIVILYFQSIATYYISGVFLHFSVRKVAQGPARIVGSHLVPHRNANGYNQSVVLVPLTLLTVVAIILQLSSCSLDEHGEGFSWHIVVPCSGQKLQQWRETARH